MGWNPFSKTKTIDDLKPEEIQKEKVKLEVEEQKISRRIRTLNAEEDKTLEIAADSDSSEVDDRIAARKIQSIRAELNEKQVRAQVLSDRLMAMTRIESAKARQKELEEKGLWADIAGMQLDELGDKLTEMAVEDRGSRARTREIIDILGVDNAQVKDEEPAEIRSIQQEIAARRKDSAG